MKWSKLFLPVMVVSMIAGMSSCGKDDGSSSVPQRPSGGNQADSIAIAGIQWQEREIQTDRKSTRLNSSHYQQSRMPSSA